MISALSAATAGINRSMAQFDGAVTSIANEIGTDAGTGSGLGDSFESAIVTMITARIAMQASVKMAQASTEMLSEVLKLGDFAVAAPTSR